MALVGARHCDAWGQETGMEIESESFWVLEGELLTVEWQALE